MPRPKKRPWNADLKMPGLDGERPHVAQPSPQTVTVGHSTAAHFVEPRGWVMCCENKLVPGQRCPGCRKLAV